MDCGVTYSSVTLLDTEGVSFFSKSSSDEWSDLYMNTKLYQKCHLLKEALNQINHHSDGFVFLWDNFSPTNEESVYLDHLRVEKNICHGVAFCSPLANGNRAIITVAGKNSDINFSKQVLRNKSIIYRAVMNSLVTH